MDRRFYQSRTSRKRLDLGSLPSPPSPQRQRRRLAAPTSNRIYVLLNFSDTDVVSQGLYSVDASPTNFTTDEVNQSSSPSEKIIYPVFEFMPKQGYPVGMCCEILDSKIYFWGVASMNGLMVLVRPLTLKKFTVSKPLICPSSPTDPKLALHEVAHMTSGKLHCYCFVATGQLFAIGVHDPRRPRKTLFEVYNPKKNEWTPLPDPPIKTAIGCDAVLDNMVILKNAEQTYYSFNAVTFEWQDLRGCYPGACFYGGVSRHAVFLDNTIYWESDFNIVISMGPPDRGDKIKDFLYRPASVELRDAIERYRIYNGPSTCLQYLGNRTFAYVVCGAFPDPQNP